MRNSLATLAIYRSSRVAATSVQPQRAFPRARRDRQGAASRSAAPRLAAFARPVSNGLGRGGAADRGRGGERKLGCDGAAC